MRKLPICVIFQVQKRGITYSKIDKIRRNVNLMCKSSLQSHTQSFSSIPQSMLKKVQKTTYICNIPSPRKGHNSFKIWWNHMKLKLDMWLIITKTYTKFQLNTSKHVEKNAENYLCVIFQVQQRGITHSKCDEIRRNINLICETSLKSHTQNFSSIPQSMSKKSAENYICVIIKVLKGA